MRWIDGFVVHCSASPEDEYFGPEELKKSHLNRGIRPPGGYHFQTDNLGASHWIRPIEEVGAHIYGKNETTIGFMYSGGIIAGGNPFNPKHAKDTRTFDQKVALFNAMIKILVDLTNYQDIEHITIQGHRDYSPDIDGDGIIGPWEYMKQCPCFDAAEEYEHIWKQPAVKNAIATRSRSKKAIEP